MIRTVFILSLSLCLGACGFRPLYGNGTEGARIHQSLARIDIAPIPDRVGFAVRSNLLERMTPSGTPADPQYRLLVKLTQTREGVAIERDTSITRFNLQLNARYELRDFTTNKPVYTGTSQSIAAYNVVDNQFATQSAQRDAEDRVARAVSEDITLRLAIFLDGLRRTEPAGEGS